MRQHGRAPAEGTGRHPGVADVADPAGGEAFATPAITVILPAGKAGAGFLSLALRIPMGEIGSSAGPVRLPPMILMATGLRFD